MKTKLLLFLVIFSGWLNITNAAVDYTAPVKQPSYQKNYLQQLAHISVKEIEKVTGKKLTFKQKLGLKLLKWKMRHQLKGNEDEGDAKAEKRAQNSMLFGIATWVFALIGLAIPVFFFVAIPSAIIAIVAGVAAGKNGKKYSKAKLGVILGTVFLILLVVGLIVALTAYNSFF